MKNYRGFFVRYKDESYSGPHDYLNEARTDARCKGLDLLIYHGILCINDDTHVIDDSNLFLVPEIKK